MRFGYLMFIGLMFAGVSAQADVGSCLKNLPDTIKTDSQEEAFIFKKGFRPDSYQIVAKSDKKQNYYQTYHNEVCFAKVASLATDMGRLTNTKIKRYAKEASSFQITGQDRTEIEKERFFYTMGVEQDQTNVLMVTGFNNRILQVRMTCQAMTSFEKKENRRMTVHWAKELAKNLLNVVKNCK